MSDVKDMPMGLGFRMAMNEKALNTYAEMTPEEKERVIDAARHAQSKEEMQRLVDRMGEGEKYF